MTGRKKPKILAPDPDHEHAIFKVLPKQQPIIPLEDAKPRGPKSPQAREDNSAEKITGPESSTPPAPVREKSAHTIDTAPENVARSTFRLMPLERHRADLEMLEQEGYQIDLILKGAMKAARKNTPRIEEYVPPPDLAYWKKHHVRWAFSVTNDTIAKLRAAAKDPLDALPLSELVRGQITSAWIPALDEAIAKVKRAL
ncbi:hypothetical protein [Roseinatronobacter monicus]|uniref:Uncharacterized protein n=1 Tax=Roseinatronobacter monicus TaxID=393481 RepID=A0A543K3E8_9RHOB|nr:hypothetical protein [Roseinatronobacter monicus]TQM89597.1 hypothetical protein BD293_4621 [Roseinatronobacter monicus]